MANVAVAQPVLHQARVRAVVGQDVTAGVAEHMWMHRAEPGPLTGLLDQTARR